MKIIKKKKPKVIKSKGNPLVKLTKAPKLKNKLTLVKSSNTPAYYHCLAAKVKHGLKPSLANCCQECKEQSTKIALNRQQEIKKLASAYQQLGISLTKLLKN